MYRTQETAPAGQTLELSSGFTRAPERDQAEQRRKERKRGTKRKRREKRKKGKKSGKGRGEGAGLEVLGSYSSKGLQKSDKTKRWDSVQAIQELKSRNTQQHSSGR